MVTVDSDGAGNVTLAVALDAETAASQPSLFEDLAVADLLAEGWTVSDPMPDGEGLVWVRARHGFDDPAEVARLVAAVSGDRGPFRDFSVVRSDGFAETSYRFEGTVDFVRGASVALGERAASSGARAEVAAALADDLDDALGSLVTVRVGVRLPGDVSSNALGASTQADNGAVWEPSVLADEPVVLRASGVVRHGQRWVLVGLGMVIVFAFVLFVLVRLAIRRRSVLDGRTRLS